MCFEFVIVVQKHIKIIVHGYIKQYFLLLNFALTFIYKYKSVHHMFVEIYITFTYINFAFIYACIYKFCKTLM